MTVNLTKDQVFEMLLEAVHDKNLMWTKIHLEGLLQNKNDILFGNISKIDGIRLGYFSND